METVKIDGKFEICDELLKKGRQKFWRMKIKTFFWEKVKLGKFCMESEKIWERGGGNLKQRGNASLPQGGDGRLWLYYTGRGLSIKYVTLFLANFDPPPSVTLCHTSRDPPPKVRHTNRTPPIFTRPSTKNPDKITLYKFSLNCLGGFCLGAFTRGCFVWKLLSGVIFVSTSFCQNTSVTTES